MVKPDYQRRRCADCGREGTRGFMYSTRGVYVCSNRDACKKRKSMPLWRIREMNEKARS